MKRIILALLIVCAVETALAQSVERRIREFAAQQYPSDSQMQQYVYDKQISAYRYMRSVKDLEVKDIAAWEGVDFELILGILYKRSISFNL